MGVITVVFVAAAYYWLTRRPSAHESFWGPVLRSAPPPVIVLAQGNDAGDAIAMARIASHLSPLGRTPLLKTGREAKPEELRNLPAILIGGAPAPQGSAVVTRVFPDGSQQPRITLEGDTALAAEFLTARPWIAEGFRAAPEGWERKNLQLTLRTEGSPPAPKVINLRVW
jgi:hypothetical protein